MWDLNDVLTFIGPVACRNTQTGNFANPPIHPAYQRYRTRMPMHLHPCGMLCCVEQQCQSMLTCAHICALYGTLKISVLALCHFPYLLLLRLLIHSLLTPSMWHWQVFYTKDASLSSVVLDAVANQEPVCTNLFYLRGP